ncbi:MAG: hypothetical protein V7609_1134 [Verrucomicrobiota bacterium]
MGIRTPGLVIANDALYQLSYTPESPLKIGLKPTALVDLHTDLLHKEELEQQKSKNRASNSRSQTIKFLQVCFLPSECVIRYCRATQRPANLQLVKHSDAQFSPGPVCKIPPKSQFANRRRTHVCPDRFRVINALMIFWLLGIGGAGFVLLFTIVKWLSSDPQLRKTLLSRIIPALHQRLTFFRQRYNQAIVSRLAQLDNRGLRGAESLDVGPHYVSLRLAYRDLGDTRNLILQEHEKTRSFYIWDILRSHWPADRCLAIISPSGSGKTTLLQHVGIVLAKPVPGSSRRARLRRIPIFLRLHDYSETILKDMPSLGDLMSRIEKPYRPPQGWFERQLRLGRCLVMLDGVDEIGGASAREKTITWIEQQMTLYKSQFIVTGRPEGFDRRPINATALTICPFGPSEISAFIENWYRPNNARKRLDRPSESARHRDIVERLKTPVLASFAMNPLLLTMMLIVHDSGRTLPQSRTELCNEICDVLLHHRQKAKGIEDGISLSDKRRGIELLAFEMTFKKLPSWDRFFVERIVGPERYDSACFLSVLITSGILFEIGSRLTFSHRSFREFLTAAYIAHNDLHAALTDNLFDRSLDEVRRFYSGLTGSKEIINACLDKVVGHVSAADLMPLIYDCAVESEVDSSVWWRLRGHLESDARSHFWEDAARILLSLRVRGLLLGGAISRDNTFITNVEFRLYREQAPHSTNVWQYRQGEEFAPARGVTFTEAKHFCAWLHGHGNERFRLPNGSEIGDVALCSAIETLKFVDGDVAVGYWLQERSLRASEEVLARTQSSLPINVNTYLYLDNTKGEIIQTVCQFAAKLKRHMEAARQAVKWLDPERSVDSLREHSQPEKHDPLNLTIQNLDEEWKHEMAYGKTSGWECARDLERALEIAFEIQVATEEVRHLAKPWDPILPRGLILVRLLQRTLREFNLMKLAQQRSRARVTFVICAFVSDTVVKMSTVARSRYVAGPKCRPKIYELLRDDCLEAFWSLVLIEQRTRSTELNCEGIKIVRELVDFERGSDE